MFPCEDRDRARGIFRILHRLPPLAGRPVRIEDVAGLRDRRGPVHAGAFLRERRIAFDCRRRQFPRIFVHEVFHFVWLRLGNPRRRSWESLLAREMDGKAAGELGWSAEWRKARLTARDRTGRTRAWREYCCESFCDTAAWLYAGSGGHPEFTLSPRRSAARGRWFGANVGAGASI